MDGCAMEKAWGVIKQLSADEQERLEAEATEKARRDFISRIRAAKREGREERDIELRTSFAVKMLRHNDPVEYISELTGFSVEEIAGIARNINVNE